MTAVAAGAAFDRIAAQYDELWSETAVGQAQRAAVWQRIDPIFTRGSRVLDLGCGSGVDAAHLMRKGVDVVAVDASAEMVRVARARGVDARHATIETLEFDAIFDGALSDFGALNCVADLPAVARCLGRLIRPGGTLALCVLGRCCAWEVAHFVRAGEFAKGFRRFRGECCGSSLGVRVFYHSAAKIHGAFAGQFRLTGSYGVGVCVPPSYVTALSAPAVARMAAFDRRIGHLPVLRALGDHRLFFLERI